MLFIAYFREIAAAALLYTASTQVLSISIWAFFVNANWGVASALSIVTTGITVTLMATVMHARRTESLTMGISVKGLMKHYDGGGKPVVNHIDFEIADGELVSLLGPSGCGKTTTLHAVSRVWKRPKAVIS